MIILPIPEKQHQTLILDALAQGGFDVLQIICPESEDYEQMSKKFYLDALSIAFKQKLQTSPHENLDAAANFLNNKNAGQIVKAHCNLADKCPRPNENFIIHYDNFVLPISFKKDGDTILSFRNCGNINCEAKHTNNKKLITNLEARYCLMEYVSVDIILSKSFEAIEKIRKHSGPLTPYFFEKFIEDYDDWYEIFLLREKRQKQPLGNEFFKELFADFRLIHQMYKIRHIYESANTIYNRYDQLVEQLQIERKIEWYNTFRYFLPFTTGFFDDGEFMVHHLDEGICSYIQLYDWYFEFIDYIEDAKQNFVRAKNPN